MTAERSGPERRRCRAAAGAALLFLALSGFHPAPAPAQSDRLSLIDVPIPLRHEICRQPHLWPIDPLPPQVAAELARCALAAGDSEAAACRALRGLELAVDGLPEEAATAFDAAREAYRHLHDPWGLWITDLFEAASTGATTGARVAGDRLERARYLLAGTEASSAPPPARSLRLFGELLGWDDEILGRISAAPRAAAPEIRAVAAPLLGYLLGVARGCDGRFEDAEEPLREALRRVKARPDLFSQASLYSFIHEQLGWAYLKLYRLDDAVLSYGSALQHAELQGASRVALVANLRLSQAYAELGRFDTAIRANQRAIALAGADLRPRLWIENAVLYARGGHVAALRDALSQARRRMTEPALEEWLLAEAGRRLLYLDIHEEAARALETAAGLRAGETTDLRRQATLEAVRFSLVDLYGRLGLATQRDLQRDLLDRWCQVSGSRTPVATELVLASRAAVAAQMTPASTARALDALRAFREMLAAEGHLARPEALDVDDGLALVEGFLGAGDADELSAFIGGLDSEFARALLNPTAEALFAFERRRWKRGIRHLAKSRDLSQSLVADSRPTRLDEAQRRMEWALTDLLQERRNLATVRARDAIAMFEQHVGGMRVAETIAGLLDQAGYDLYRKAVDIFAQLDPREAFDLAEKGRAYTLRRMLASRRVAPGAATAREETDLLAEIAHLDQRLATLPPSTAPELEAELETSRRRFAALRLNRQLAAEQSPLRRREPPSLDRLQRQILKPDTALLAYFSGLGRLLIWVVDRDRVTMRSIPFDQEQHRQELACLIQNLRRQGRPPEAPRPAARRGVRPLTDCGQQADAAAALYRRLILPVAPSLRHRRLIVIPHGLLHHLPFAALRNPETGDYLAREFTLSLAPSAGALELLARARNDAGDRVLILGDPETPLGPLAGARREVETVARLTGVEPLVGPRATESELYRHGGRVRLLHLAAHGQYLPRHPLFSRILLSRDERADGSLDMHEVADRLDLTGTGLVVLSGCQTALGELHGEEVLGLTQAFLVAGSRAVVSTLWPIHDDASELLMSAFYRHFLERQLTAAEALRQAQLEMMAHPELAEPYYWAGFTVTGDPDRRWLTPPAPADQAPRAIPERSAADPRVADPLGIDPVAGLRGFQAAGLEAAAAIASAFWAQTILDRGPGESPFSSWIARESLTSDLALRPPLPSLPALPRIVDGGPDGDAVMTDAERLRHIDRGLDAIFAEIDRRLLREQQILAGRRRRRPPAGGAAPPTGNATTTPATGNATASTSGPADPPAADPRPPDRQSFPVPADIPDAGTDDVLARQLREAATHQRDPELRRRLWQDYRRYMGLPLAGEPGTTPRDAADHPPEEGGLGPGR